MVARGWLGFPCELSWLLDELLAINSTKHRTEIGRIRGVMGADLRVPGSCDPSHHDTPAASRKLASHCERHPRGLDLKYYDATVGGFSGSVFLAATETSTVLRITYSTGMKNR